MINFFEYVLALSISKCNISPVKQRT